MRAATRSAPAHRAPESIEISKTSKGRRPSGRRWPRQARCLSPCARSVERVTGPAGVGRAERRGIATRAWTGVRPGSADESYTRLPFRRPAARVSEHERRGRHPPPAVACPFSALRIEFRRARACVRGRGARVFCGTPCIETLVTLSFGPELGKDLVLRFWCSMMVQIVHLWHQGPGSEIHHSNKGGRVCGVRVRVTWTRASGPERVPAYPDRPRPM